MMNNNGAIYVARHDAVAVAIALGNYMLTLGFRPAACGPGDMGGRIFAPEKRRRLFFVMPPSNGWVTVWEDPRYFGDRHLARHLARALGTRAVWIEVAGNGVAWARGIYESDMIIEERYEEMDTIFYGEYGTLHFAFDIENSPDELIERLGLPYPALHYESVLEGGLPEEAGEPIYLAFERSGPASVPTDSQLSEIGRQAQ